MNMMGIPGMVGDFIGEMIDVALTMAGVFMIVIISVVAALIIAAIARGAAWTMKTLSRALEPRHHTRYIRHHMRHHRPPRTRIEYREPRRPAHTSNRPVIVDAWTKPVKLPRLGEPVKCGTPFKLPAWISGSINGVELSGATCCLIGCGGWGCVYKCETGNGVYALKASLQVSRAIEAGEPPPTIREPTAMAEARWVYGLSHPNLLRVLGISSIIPVAVYEYANQGSLRPWISRGVLKGELLIHSAIHIASGLRYLHSRGLIHGDVKPENVLVSNGILKLGDYSSVRSLLEDLGGSRTSRRGVCTPGYCAPEQVYSDLARKAREAGFEDRIDVYQLGVLILEAETGATLDGYKRVGMPGDRLQGLLSRVNPLLRGLVGEMISEDPLARPSSDEVLRRLTRVYMGG